MALSLREKSVHVRKIHQGCSSSRCVNACAPNGNNSHMLNRRILRIKAFKVLYSYAVKGGMSLQDALAELDASCESTRDLSLFMLALVAPLCEEEGRRIAAAKTKFNPTEEDLSASERFASNRVATLLSEDKDFQKLISKKGLSWDQYDIVIGKILNSVHGKQYYKKYMALPEATLSDDCKVLSKVFEQELVDMSEVEDLIEEKNISWTDALAYALTWCCHTMDDLSHGEKWRLPSVYQSDMTLRRNPSATVSSDRDFSRKLLSAAFSGYENYFKKVVSMTPDWDSDRLFSADMAIIALCMAEMDTYSDIPARVSINEWVEISKWYSSPKSSQFVNGILDKVLKEKSGAAE